HTVWSICVPIAIVEALVPRRSTTPWLGWFGLGVTTVLFILGCALIFRLTYNQEGFLAPTPQLLGVVVAVALAVAAAFLVKSPRPHSGSPPEPWKVGAFAFLAASTFLGVRYFLADWPIV